MQGLQIYTLATSPCDSTNEDAPLSPRGSVLSWNGSLLSQRDSVTSSGGAEPPLRRSDRRHDSHMSIRSVASKYSVASVSSMRSNSTARARPSRASSKRKEQEPFSWLAVVEEDWFQYFVAAVISMNVFVLWAETDAPQLSRVWHLCDHVFLFVFLVELVLKVLHYSPRGYFFGDYRWWGFLDALVISLTILDLWIMALVEPQVASTELGPLRWMRLLRLLRAMKIVRILNTIRDYVHSTTLFTCLGVGRTMLGILLVCHYLACLLYTVGTFNHDEQDSWLTTLHRSDIGYVYITALHWSITQFTPASMEINPQNAYERAFAIVTIIVGLVAFSSFVSSITAAMAALHKTREARMKQTGDIRRYIIENRLSLGLGSSIMAFVKAYDFNAQIRLHEADLPLFSVLPESIRVRLRWEIYQPFLARYPLFEHLCSISDRGVVTICNGSMSERSLVLSQDLFTADEEATSMYFVVHGTLEYFHGWDDTHLKELSQDEWICEVSLWAKWEHGGRVAALTPSEVMVLNAGSFRRIGGRFPEIQAPCCIYASQYIKRIRTAQHDQPVDIWCDKVECAQIVQSAIAKLDTGASAAGPRTVAQAWSKVNEKESPAAPVIS
mmetsp:Transcript_1868/g.4796  ORF Transcript_1868/g.4796 Transcript_1868/m.4796 type:complete len:611 (-) Transcript_1868:21-1853(-)